MILPFSSLSSSQRTQAAATFRDDFFGAHPEDYLYEVSAAMGGELTGQRIPMEPKPIKRTRQKNMPFRIAKSAPLALPDQAAKWLARKLLESLTISTSIIDIEVE